MYDAGLYPGDSYQQTARADSLVIGVGCYDCGAQSIGTAATRLQKQIFKDRYGA
jgi:hypothetical protein